MHVAQKPIALLDQQHRNAQHQPWSNHSSLNQQPSRRQPGQMYRRCSALPGAEAIHAERPSHPSQADRPALRPVWLRRSYSVDRPKNMVPLVRDDVVRHPPQVSQSPCATLHMLPVQRRAAVGRPMPHACAPTRSRGRGSHPPATAATAATAATGNARPRSTPATCAAPSAGATAALPAAHPVTALPYPRRRRARTSAGQS